jgi:16S rRNA (uracil1498-N3)-methyltransferase
MECFIVEQGNVKWGESLLLVGDEAKHAIRSLRMKEGERLMATDLHGTCHECEIASIAKLSKDDWQAECTILSTLNEHNESSKHVHLVIGILQQTSKFEDILEKCTELGVSEFTPVISSRSEKTSLNYERAERILRSATKQVSRARMPKLNAAAGLEDILRSLQDNCEAIYLFHEAENAERAFATNTVAYRSAALVIGPEGGFTDTEVALGRSLGGEIYSLGIRRLRAETAAIAACAIALA